MEELQANSTGTWPGVFKEQQVDFPYAISHKPHYALMHQVLLLTFH